MPGFRTDEDGVVVVVSDGLYAALVAAQRVRQHVHHPVLRVARAVRLPGEAGHKRNVVGVRPGDELVLPCVPNTRS